jgi:hypothetical protein
MFSVIILAIFVFLIYSFFKGNSSKSKIKFKTGRNSFNVGEAFEDYVQNYLFPPGEYNLVEKTHSYKTNYRRYVEASLKPDFKFRSKTTGSLFYVEAKYRSNAYEVVKWCEQYQYERYKIYNNDIPLYIALGIGGSPFSPQYVFFIPFKRLHYNTLKPSLYTNYIIPHKHFVIIDNFN